MQQYQVEMIAQFDNFSNSSSFSDSEDMNLLPLTPEEVAYSEQAQQYSACAEQYYTGAYDATYETAAAPMFADYTNAFNMDESALICEEIPQTPAKATKKKTKKQLCQFWLKGCCERGVTCTYAHGEHQLGQEVAAAPIATCKWWMQGTCRVKNCKYAHFRTDVEGELFAFDKEQSKLAAKEALKPQANKKVSYNGSETSYGTESRFSTGSQSSQASTLNLESALFASEVEAVPAFQKPQCAMEREQLMALLGNVMAALQ